MKKTWLALLLMALIALALRVYRLDYVSLRGDEAFTVIFVQRTWDGLWRGIRLIEPNPPLMYLVLRVWVAIAGTSEFVTRYFSAFFGVLCVPLFYRLAREMFGGARGRTIAVFAALLVTINPYQIWHSQDVRNYTMWPAQSLLALVFFWQWWKGETKQVDTTKRETTKVVTTKLAPRYGILSYAALVLYALATLASLYTHYYDTFILVAENIFVFALAGFGRRWATLARWISAQVALALLYLPWVLFGTNRVTTYGEPSAEQSIALLDQFSRTLSSFVLSDTVPEELKSFLWLPLALALVVVFLYMVRRAAWRENAFFVFLYIAVPTVALFVISIGRPLFLERYLNGIAPAYYLVFAVGLAALYCLARGDESRPLPVAIVSTSLIVLALVFFLATSAYALSNYYFDAAYAKAPDWRALAQVISSQQQPGDIIVQNFNEMSAIYYRTGTLPVVTIPKDFWATPEDEKSLERVNRDYDRIWFLPASPDAWDPNHFSERYLQRHDQRLMDREIAPLRLQLYATPRQFTSKIIPINARVGQATLVGYQIDGMEMGVQVSDHSTLVLRLYWRPIEKTSKDLRVFVHLVDASGRSALEQDGIPAEGSWATPEWVPGELIVDTHRLAIDAAPGAYSLYAGMYDPASMVRAPVSDANGVAQPGDRAFIVPVTVTP